MCVAKKWLPGSDASVTFEDIVEGRVGCLSLSPARGPRCYIMGAHNFELGDKLRVVLGKQQDMARWIREHQESPGLSIIYGDFNFSAAGAPRWKLVDGAGLTAAGQSAGDRAERQTWVPLLSRTLDITKHEATHT